MRFLHLDTRALTTALVTSLLAYEPVARPVRHEK